MKAIAVFPGKANSIHLCDVPKPQVSDVPDERGVLVRLLRVGVDGTDRSMRRSTGHHRREMTTSLSVTSLSGSSRLWGRTSQS